MENFNNEDKNNEVNNTPNYNSEIYSNPVPTPGQFDSGVNYGQQAANNQQAMPNYQAPVQPRNNVEEPVSLGEWIGTILLSLIPCVNIVLLFVWAFSSTEKKSKSNWAKATLIILAIAIVVYIILVIALVASIGSVLSSFGDLYSMLY